jgi:amphi-Trp domain-containing protein
MQEEKRNFRHESLQDKESIQAILKSLGRAINKGRVTFSDEDGEMLLEPEGLLNVKLTANKDEGRHRMTLRISWQVEEKLKAKKSLKVK